MGFCLFSGANHSIREGNFCDIFSWPLHVKGKHTKGITIASNNHPGFSCPSGNKHHPVAVPFLCTNIDIDCFDDNFHAFEQNHHLYMSVA